MAFIYAVRCNFNHPDLEQAWNDWYSGPKLRQMLAKPFFLSGQRFAAVDLDTTRKYLALWSVESPDAFTTSEYRSDWGFFEWTPYIIDWSRDLYLARNGDSAGAVEVPSDGALYLMSFDGLSAEEAERARAHLAASRPDVQWLTAVGLDKHSPLLGLLATPSATWRPATPLAELGVHETLYRPVSAFAQP